MARFTVAARRVMDPGLPVHVCFLAFPWSIDSYSGLTGETFHGTYERLGRAVDFDWNQRLPTAEQLQVAVTLLTRERQAFLVALRAFGAERKTQKRELGQRQPTRSQLRHLYFGAWFEAPGVHRKASSAMQRLLESAG